MTAPAPLTRTALAQLLKVTAPRLQVWMDSDPQFPKPTLVDARGLPAWNPSTVKRYRGTLITLREFAKLLGKSFSTVQSRQLTDPDFPAPIMPPTQRSTNLWRRRDAIAYKEAYTGPKAVPAIKSNILLTFAQFADLMGMGEPGLHRLKKNDTAFPPPLTAGRGAVWARADAEKYKRFHSAGGPRPRWHKRAAAEFDLVTLDEFAEITGLAKKTVVMYRSQSKPGFPPPALDSRYPVWRRGDVEAYAEFLKTAPRGERSRRVPLAATQQAVDEVFAGVVEEDAAEAGPVCPRCGIPLTPRPVMVDGHPAMELVCPDHGVQSMWQPFS